MLYKAMIEPKINAYLSARFFLFYKSSLY